MKTLQIIIASVAGQAALSSAAKHAASPPQGAGAAPSTPPPFDAASQYVSTSGQYAFVPPGPSDARGPCPGLNAMANHGYLPHNGVATIAQFAEACQTVFGMGPDLAAFLAVYGAVVDGDLTSWSIDGAPHVGIGGSHGNYESDSSPLKADLYQYGSLDQLVIKQYKELFNMQRNPATANYNLEVLRDFRGSRFHESVAKNPVFYYGPFNGMIVSQAAFTFIYRFMANKSAEYPEGVLDQDVLKSFMAISGSNSKPVWTRGYERIPDNWYKRNAADVYTIPYFNMDISYFGDKYPEINEVGCNQGKVNTFKNISTPNLPAAARSVPLKRDSTASPFCSGLEFALAELPTLTGLSSTALAPLTKLLNEATSELNCTTSGGYNMTELAACPGFALYGGPTAKKAKGAKPS